MKFPVFFIYVKNTDTGMSSQRENQQWDVIRMFSGLFPIILGEKGVFFPPPMKNGDFSLINLFPFQFGGFFVAERNL